MLEIALGIFIGITATIVLGIAALAVLSWITDGFSD